MSENLRLSKEEEEWRTLGAAWVTEHTLSTIFRRLSEARGQYYDIVKEYGDRMLEVGKQRSDLLVSRGEVQDDLSRLQRVCRELNGDVATLHDEGEEARAEANRLSNYKTAYENLRRLNEVQIKVSAEITAQRDEARASHQAAQSLLVTHSEALTKEQERANGLAEELNRAQVELDLLKMSNPLGDGEHVAEFAQDSWTLKHPLECRETGLFDCPVNKAIREGGPPLFLGRYRVTVGANGVLSASKI